LQQQQGTQQKQLRQKTLPLLPLLHMVQKIS